MANHWYVLRTKPNKEDSVWQQVQARGFVAYYPRFRVQPINPRARKIKPYFPGYLFVRADLDALGLGTFQYMPYTHGLVCFGGEPARVPDALVQTLRKRVGDFPEGYEEIESDFKHRDPVWIHDGIFAGYEAIFDARISGHDRVRVLLRMLNGQSVKVEMFAAQISAQ